MHDVVTAILGGGQGSRLWPLTRDRAKPAVPLGGKFRLIDVAISNSLHAGYDRIFVLTQFNSASLHRHLAHTYRFDAFRGGFVDLMAAEQGLDNRDWYQGPMQVLFSSDRDGNGEIYRMLPDGRNVQRLTFTDDAWETSATGSPDGRRIAYVRQETGGPQQIWLMSRDGRSAQMLTGGPSDNSGPTWSADSTKLAFASNRDGDWEIYLMDLATHSITRLTDNDRDDTQPDWSRIGGRIAFVSSQYAANGELFTMAADGSDVQQLTSNVNGDSQPSWSPLANRLVFHGTRPAGQALYTVRSDGADVHLLAPQSLQPASPAWGLAGDTIVFSGFRPDSGYSEIMRIEADGSGLALLTNNEVNFDYSPGWLPGW